MNEPASPTSRVKPILILLLLGLLAGAYYLLEVRGHETTDDAQLEASIVPVSAKVSGYVTELKIQDNQTVHAGDLLLKVDPTDYQIAVDKAKAELDGAFAQYEQATQNLAATKVSAPSSLEAARAAVASARADHDRAVKDAARNRQMKNIGATTRTIEQSDADEKITKAKLEQAEAALLGAETSPQAIAGADAGARVLLAQISQKKADLAQAEKNLADTEIKTPIDGKITQRGVETGAYIQTGQPLLAVVGAKFWVVANFKETQLGSFHTGMPVDIRIDAFPKMKFAGKIESLQSGTGGRLSLFPPENATGNFVKVVQRVPVKIEFDAPPDAALPLAPGMSVMADVHVE